MMKLVILIVPLFVLTWIATAKTSHICRWSLVANCYVDDDTTPSPPPPSQFVRPYFFHSFLFSVLHSVHFLSCNLLNDYRNNNKFCNAMLEK